MAIDLAVNVLVGFLKRDLPILVAVRAYVGSALNRLSQVVAENALAKRVVFLADLLGIARKELDHSLARLGLPGIKALIVAAFAARMARVENKDLLTRRAGGEHVIDVFHG